MNIPFFSIITVVKNDFPGLLKTATSLGRQTNRSFQWIVIDGKSVDGTVENLNSLPVVPAIFVSETDNGIYDAMNKGIRHIRGDYSLFLNAGDCLQSDSTLHEVKDFILGQEDVDVVYAGTNLEFGKGRVRYRPPRNTDGYIWHGLPAIHQATYIRSGLLRGFNYPGRYRISGDYFLAATLYKSGIKAIYYNHPVVRFRTGETSFRHPLVVIHEAYIIQKEVLQAGLPRIILSCLRRICAMLAMLFLVTISEIQNKLTGDAK